MAMVAVKLVLEKLSAVAAEEARLQTGIRRGIDELRGDLESMKAFLQDAECRSDADQVLKTWVKQVRDAAYDAEDALEAFFHCLSPPPRHRSNLLRDLLRFITQLKARRRLALQILRIKADVKAISERKNAFNLRRNDESPVEDRWHDPRLASLWLEEAEIVGIENPRNLLIPWLIEGGERLTAISIVGMGGLGKTTLVKKVFDCQPVKNHFSCHAWITVSKSFSALELLRAALKGFLQAMGEKVIVDELETMDTVQLVEAIKAHLKEKRYVIVFDDVWSIDAWSAVKFALPDCDCGSRVIFTTRMNNVAKMMELETNGHIHHLQPLPEEEAWTLFCMKAFWGECNGVCPRHLEAMSVSMLKKCGGLPLAIVAIAGLLLKKDKSAVEWKKVHDSLAAELKSDDNLVSLERILLLSYNELPYHLKSCYLYLSVFPEDYLIKRMKLVRLWVIERFVEGRPGLTMEEVAETYLNELVSRSMVQVVEMDYVNRVKTLRVHDLMREIIQLKSRDESLVVVIDGKDKVLNHRIRRLSIQGSSDNFLSEMKLPHLRSFLLFSPTGSSTPLLYFGFRFLRLLELELAPLTQFPAELVELIHLRYLSLRRTMLRELPESIGKLKNLEILDLKGTYVSAMPNGILQLRNLCQLRSYRYRSGSSMYFPDTYGIAVPKGIGRLTSLQKLGSVDINGDNEMVRELGKLTQLRRLGILRLGGTDGLTLSSSLEKMKHLTSLYMDSNSTDDLEMDPAISPPKFLQNFYLKCSVKLLPDWITSLQYLAKLVLQRCNLHDDPLKTLAGLPNLTLLEIRQAYHGEELFCETIGYMRLKKLGLYDLSGLKRIRVAEGAMPGLVRLDIASCGELETVPSGIEHLKSLQDLLLWDMPNRYFNLIEHPHGADFWKVQHISTIKCVYENGGRWATRTLQCTSSVERFKFS